MQRGADHDDAATGSAPAEAARLPRAAPTSVDAERAAVPDAGAGVNGGIYYGWWVAGVSTLAFTATVPGQTLLVSELNAPLQRELGIGDTPLAVAYFVATMGSGLLLPRIGAWFDRIGPRRSMTLAGAALAGAVALLAWSQFFWWVLLGFFAVRLVGQGALSLSSQHAIAMWFHERLGIVNGLKMVLSNAGWAIFPLTLLVLSEHVGWRWGYTIIGIACALLVAPLAWLVVRDTPESMGLRLDNAKAPETRDDDAPVKEVGYTLKQAGRTRSYWLVIVASLASPAIGTAILFHLQPLLIERGIGPADAESVEAGAKVVSANAKTLWALVMIAASLPAGWLCDRLAPRWVFAAGLASLGLTCGMLYAATSPGLVYLSILPFGVCNALLFTIVPTATARFFGRAHHGEIRGAVGRWVIFATAAGPALMSLPQEVTGDFSLSLLLFAASTVPGVALALLIRPPGPVAEADGG